MTRSACGSKAQRRTAHRLHAWIASSFLLAMTRCDAGLLSVRPSAALGEGLAGHLAGGLVLDGDGLHGGGGAEGEGLGVERAFSRGRAAVGGVVDAGLSRTAEGHLGRLGERRGAANGGSSHSGRLTGAAAVARVTSVTARRLAAAVAGVASVVAAVGAVAARTSVAFDVEGCAHAGREVVVGGAQFVEVDDVAGGVGARLANVVEALAGLGHEDDAVGEDLDGVAALVGALADADGRVGVHRRGVSPVARVQVVDEDGLGDDFALVGTREGGDVGRAFGGDSHAEAALVGGVTDQVEVVAQAGLGAVGVDLDALEQLLDELSAFSLALTVGDEGSAAHFAEHSRHLGGELQFGTVAHLSSGAGVSHSGLILAQEDLAALAFHTDGRTGASGELED